MYRLVNFKTKEEIIPKDLIFTGENGELWEVEMNLDAVKRRINADYFRKEQPNTSKYLPLLPIEDHSRFVSLSEGATSLIPSKKLGKQLDIQLLFKNETQNPTGSFKDRGSAVDITKAIELGAEGVAVASTGNMAASCACYAAAAGMPCFVFVPEGTPPSKLAQVIAYGGKIVQVKGSFNDAASLSQKTAKKLNFYLAGDYAFRVEGQKTAAFEVIDQLFYRVPDMVVLPMGCGTNLAAYWKGFSEYLELGLIDKLPRLIGVQSAGACAIVDSFKQKKKTISRLNKLDTVASAIAVSFPWDGVKALEALYTSGGEALQVSDKEILEAQYLLAKEEGLFVESAAAASFAGVLKLSKKEDLESKQIACVLTGSGLKDPSTVLKVAVRPPTIYPEVKEFLSLYENSFFDGKNVVFIDTNTVLFDSMPNKKKIKKQISQFFETSFSKEHVAKFERKIKEFLQKGKVITFSDLQDIIEDVLESPKAKTKFFTVDDFEVTTGKDRKSEANVVVQLNGDRKTARASGVGPVDAVINALRRASGEEMNFSLADYKVDIRSGDTDAVVSVEIKLLKNGDVSIGQETSPDIIQASIYAFEDAYNGFGN